MVAGRRTTIVTSSRDDPATGRNFRGLTVADGSGRDGADLAAVAEGVDAVGPAVPSIGATVAMAVRVASGPWVASTSTGVAAFPVPARVSSWSLAGSLRGSPHRLGDPNAPDASCPPRPGGAAQTGNRNRGSAAGTGWDIGSNGPAGCSCHTAECTVGYKRTL